MALLARAEGGGAAAGGCDGRSEVRERGGAGVSRSEGRRGEELGFGQG